MSSPCIEFFLTPDGSSSRKVKIDLNQRAPGLYRMVGTWPELMALATSLYLLLPGSDDWSARLSQASARPKDAFWAASYQVAPRETLAEIETAICRLSEAMGPDQNWQTLLDSVPAQTRLHSRLLDMERLVQSCAGLPGDLQMMADILNTSHPPLRPIQVYFSKKCLQLNPWQHAVLNKLQNDAPAPEPRMQDLLENAFKPPPSQNPTLNSLRNLYAENIQAPGSHDGVRLIAVRDSLTEAEIAAGLIQTALSRGTPIQEIGLLLPDDVLSLTAVHSVFNRCGLPLSGFQRAEGQRDLGYELLRTLLLCLRKPMPIMALAALLTSPLMSWSQEQGHAMAQAVMDGDVNLKSTPVSAAARHVLEIIKTDITTTSELKIQLDKIHQLLSKPEQYPEHAARSQEGLNQLQAASTGMEHLDWDRLLTLVTPTQLHVTQSPEFKQETIAVFREGGFPWCSVSHLFVLGFNDGHYPAGVGSSSVFSDTEWQLIAQSGLPVVTREHFRNRQRFIFNAQLAAAKDQVTLLLPRRDAGGKPLELSASLAFLCRCLDMEPEDLILDIDRTGNRAEILDLPLAEDIRPSPIPELVVTDLELKTDLLKAFGRDKDQLAPLSPSAADTLMVSPLAWLLGRLGCDPKIWIPDDFDVLKAGTLAHRVFEDLFAPDQALPAEAHIKLAVPRLLRERILQIAPFLRSPDWRVERIKFEAEVMRAAVHWRKLLISCQAQIVAAEQWLRGNHGEVPLHGQSDLLLQLPSGKLLVVDYKKSSSAKRRDRMRSGFDLQAHLYRQMIQTGGLPDFESISKDIGIVYYLLNDTTALADSPVDQDGATPGWEILSVDISSRAMLHLDQRLQQIRQGIVKLNTTADENWWLHNASLPIYALDNSPLLRLFIHPEEPAP